MTMDDKRKVPRRRVLKEGKIVFADAMRVIDCTIRDMSADGARLLIASTVGVPDTFNLYEKSTGKLYPTSIVWRQSNAVGVRFDGPGTSIHDVSNKRYARLKFA
jgi:two-component system cell cycle response regulator